MQTTIALSPETKRDLAEVKVHPRESYGDVIRRLLTEHDERRSASDREGQRKAS